jgi:hypothetical protein
VDFPPGTGKRVGSGRDFDLNTRFLDVTSSVTDQAMKEYSRPVTAG